jgi:hypothetical protein
VKVKEQYQVKISERNSAPENYDDDDDDDDDVDISRASGSIRGNIKASATESLHYCKTK